MIFSPLLEQIYFNRLHHYIYFWVPFLLNAVVINGWKAVNGKGQHIKDSSFAWLHLLLPRRLVCQKPNVKGDQTDKYLVSACATMPPLQVTSASAIFMELRKYPGLELTLTPQSKL